jgi:drug/metabolite transporter (DMT)-like permease
MKKFNGLFLALLASIFWGISGVCVQFLFQRRGISIEWLVTVRLLLAGILLLLISVLRGKNIFVIWKGKKDLVGLFIFAIIGMLSVQYTYFAAIRASNAATATILQYLGPVLIYLYLAVKKKEWPHLAEWMALLLAMTGIFLLVTHGDPGSLVISRDAMSWGLLSAVALAVYTLQPAALMKRHDTSVILGWAFLIGGACLSMVAPPWKVTGTWDLYTWLNTGYIILFGTLAAFYAFMVAVRLVGPKPASLMATTEPLAATGVGIIWLGIPFGGMDWLACACIIASMVLITAFPSRNARGS